MRRKKVKLGDLLIIYWRDSFSSDAKKMDQLVEDCLWYSVGWLVKENDNFYYLIQAVHDTSEAKNEDEIDAAVAILKDQVIEIQKVA